MTVLTWTCEACNQPIRGVGFLHIEPWRVYEGSPNPDVWSVHHRHCLSVDVVDEGGYIAGYAIDTGQVSMREQLAWWTRHLAGKNWYAVSGWQEMVLRSAGVDVSGDARRELLYSVDGPGRDENLSSGASATDVG